MAISSVLNTDEQGKSIIISSELRDQVREIISGLFLDWTLSGQIRYVREFIDDIELTHPRKRSLPIHDALLSIISGGNNNEEVSGIELTPLMMVSLQALTITFNDLIIWGERKKYLLLESELLTSHWDLGIEYHPTQDARDGMESFWVMSAYSEPVWYTTSVFMADGKVVRLLDN